MKPINWYKVRDALIRDVEERQERMANEPDPLVQLTNLGVNEVLIALSKALNKGMS